MKNRKSALFGVLLIAVIIVVVLSLSYSEYHETPSPLANASIIKRDSVDAKKMIRNARMDREKMGALISGLARETSTGEVNDGIPFEETFTEEQIARGKLHTKTDPYFWEMAPGLLEEIWKKEELNHDWTNSIVTEAKEMLRDSQYQGTSFGSADCRQSLCRIEFMHESIDASNRFKNSEMANSSWISGAGNSLGGFARSDSGEITTFIYFTADGDTDTFFRMREMIALRQNL